MSNQQLRSVVLADQTQHVPWPGSPGRILPQGEPFTISILNPVFAALLADGTLQPAPPAEPAKHPGKAKA
jgi:hypothetical protein